ASPSPNVPASLDYVPASPGYFLGSDPDFDPEESFEEDPSGDDSSDDDTSKTAGPLEAQAAPAPLALPRRPVILV
nr:hypothetical protein [Tanacetum cinerariifolium]